MMRAYSGTPKASACDISDVVFVFVFDSAQKLDQHFNNLILFEKSCYYMRNTLFLFFLVMIYKLIINCARGQGMLTAV